MVSAAKKILLLTPDQGEREDKHMVNGESVKRLTALAAAAVLLTTCCGGCAGGKNTDVTTESEITTAAVRTATEPHTEAPMSDSSDITGTAENTTSKQEDIRRTENNIGITEKTYSDTDEIIELRRLTDDADDILGVAFLDYVDSSASSSQAVDALKNSFLSSVYAFLSAMPERLLVLDGSGTELYAIIPKNKNCTVRVFKASVNEDGTYNDKKNTPIFETKNGEPFVLRCNVSEIYSDVLITVSENGGNEFEFRPMLSMMDGHLAETRKVYDFSVYKDGLFDGNSVEIAYGLLLEADEIKHYTEDMGMSLFYTHDTQDINGRPCMIFAVGTNVDGQFVREKLYGVSDNLIYSYDVINDSWVMLGSG